MVFTLEVPDLKNWKVAFLISIIIPVGLLVTFKLTGILQGPITISETKTLQPVKWKFDRLGVSCKMKDEVNASHLEHDFSMNQSVFIDHYFEASSDYGGRDSVSMLVSIRAEVFDGHIESVYMVFRENYTKSKVYFFGMVRDPHQFTHKFENLSLVNFAHMGRGYEDYYMKGFLELAGVDDPRGIYIRQPVHWILPSSYNQTHQMEITFQVTYFNGTTYNRIDQPFQLTIEPDNNDSFEDAEEIGFGTRKGYVDGDFDEVDYYKIWLEQGQAVKVALAHRPKEEPDGLGIEMNVYNPNRQLITSIGYPQFGIGEIVVQVDCTGSWYIQTIFRVGQHIYLLTVSELPD